jgi:hypothetical protein
VPRRDAPRGRRASRTRLVPRHGPTLSDRRRPALPTPRAPATNGSNPARDLAQTARVVATAATAGSRTRRCARLRDLPRKDNADCGVPGEGCASRPAGNRTEGTGCGRMARTYKDHSWKRSVRFDVSPDWFRTAAHYWCDGDFATAMMGPLTSTAWTPAWLNFRVADIRQGWSCGPRRVGCRPPPDADEQNLVSDVQL